jgi:hypothetical protein
MQTSTKYFQEDFLIHAYSSAVYTTETNQPWGTFTASELNKTRNDLYNIYPQLVDFGVDPTVSFGSEEWKVYNFGLAFNIKNNGVSGGPLTVSNFINTLTWVIGDASKVNTSTNSFKVSGFANEVKFIK